MLLDNPFSKSPLVRIDLEAILLAITVSTLALVKIAWLRAVSTLLPALFTIFCAFAKTSATSGELGSIESLPNKPVVDKSGIEIPLLLNEPLSNFLPAKLVFATTLLIEEDEF